MRTFMNARLLGVTLLVVCATCRESGARTDTPSVRQGVFVQPAIPGPLPLAIVGGQLVVVEDGGGALSIRGRRFHYDAELVEQRARRLDASSDVVIRDGALFFDGRVVELPRGTLVRSIWQAIRWQGWIVVLGRTSETDAMAEMRPPFIANELILFHANEGPATVRWLASYPPPPYGGILVLDEVSGGR